MLSLWLLIAGMLLVAAVAMSIVVALAAAIRHKRWGILAVALAAVVALPASAMLVWVRSASRVESVSVAAAPVAAHNIDPEEAAAAPPRIQLLDAPSPPAAEQPANSVPPAMQLDDEPPSADRPKRPDWVDAPPDRNQHVVTIGPFTTRGALQQFNTGQIAEWVRGEFHDAWPERLGPMPPIAVDLAALTKAEHEETRETSVGEVYLRYLLLELDDSQRQRIEGALREARVVTQQRRGVQAVAVGGGALVAVVGVLHLALQAGRRRPTTPTADA